MNISVPEGRIFHPWHLWEDYRYNFYDNCGGVEKEEKSKKVIEFFSDPELTKDCMMYVVKNWRFSMEHNLTNNSLNKIAYIGQCACAYYGNIPYTVTMENWSKLNESTRKTADKIAQECIDVWYKQNKFIQRCLNLD